MRGACTAVRATWFRASRKCAAQRVRNHYTTDTQTHRHIHIHTHTLTALSTRVAAPRTTGTCTAARAGGKRRPGNYLDKRPHNIDQHANNAPGSGCDDQNGGRGECVKLFLTVSIRHAIRGPSCFTRNCNGLRMSHVLYILVDESIDC